MGIRAISLTFTVVVITWRVKLKNLHICLNFLEIRQRKWWGGGLGKYELFVRIAFQNVIISLEIIL